MYILGVISPQLAVRIYNAHSLGLTSLDSISGCSLSEMKILNQISHYLELWTPSLHPPKNDHKGPGVTRCALLWVGAFSLLVLCQCYQGRHFLNHRIINLEVLRKVNCWSFLWGKKNKTIFNLFYKVSISFENCLTSKLLLPKPTHSVP